MKGVSNVSSRIETQTGHAAVAGFELHQHFRQLRIARRAGDQADVRRAFENLLAFLLRHAADDGENLCPCPRALELLQTVKTFCSALSRMLQVL